MPRWGSTHAVRERGAARAAHPRALSRPPAPRALSARPQSVKKERMGALSLWLNYVLRTPSQDIQDDSNLANFVFPIESGASPLPKKAPSFLPDVRGSRCQ